MSGELPQLPAELGLLVLCTCASGEEAERIGRALVEEHLAACANVFDHPVYSIYRWQGAVEQAREILLLIKTTAARFEAVRKRVEELHSYDTPEIIALPLVAGSEKYLSWLREQVH